jgi:hypothetical protein
VSSSPARSAWDPRGWGEAQRANALILLALFVAALARFGTASWGLPFRFHIDEQGFVMWVAAHTEWSGMHGHSFEPQVTTYGPLVYELALAVKWLLGGFDAAEVSARATADGWLYLSALEDPSRTPLTMVEWTRAMRMTSAFAGVITVLLYTRIAHRLGGSTAAVLAAWFSALAPGLVQVSHFYTPDGLLMLFSAATLDAATMLAIKPTWRASTYAGLAIGLVLATKLTGAFVALVVPWALWSRGSGHRFRLFSAAFSGWTWLSVAASVLVYIAFTPWILQRGLGYFGGGGGPTSGAFMLATLYETDFTFTDWRFAYLGQPRGITFFTSLVPYAVGVPVTLLGALGLFLTPPRTRSFLWVALVPTTLLVSRWTVLTIRYALPLTPVFILSASLVIAALLARSGWGWKRVSLRHVTLALAAVVLTASLARGLAWTWMFTEPDPRAQASRWLAEHAHEGDLVLLEGDLPYTAPVGSANESQGALPWSMPHILTRRILSDGFTGTNARRHLERDLRGGRYLVISEWIYRRALHPAAARQYPEIHHFYRDLFAGQTGYVEVARFQPQPRLGPLVWDESEEEQLAVCFDHPPVYIFERQGEFHLPTH